MVMVSAYFDESVTDLVYSTAGYMATVRQWARFEEDWLKLLKWAGMPEGEPFHMTDYDSRAKGTIYEHWGDYKKEEFMRRAVGILRRRVIVGISSSMDLPAYSKLVVDPVRAQGMAGPPNPSYGPYSACIGHCLKLVEGWCDKNGKNDPIAYVFESGATLSGHAASVLDRISKDETARKRYRMGTWAFGSKLEHVPLQAADILAYESSKHFTKRQRLGRVTHRPSEESP